jgi:hypothetical protein
MQSQIGGRDDNQGLTLNFENRLIGIGRTRVMSGFDGSDVD